MNLLRVASGAKTGTWHALSPGYFKQKATVFIKAATWSTATVALEVSPNGTDSYTVTIGGNATVAEDTAAELDLNADYIRAVATTGGTDISVEIRSYG